MNSTTTQTIIMKKIKAIQTTDNKFNNTSHFTWSHNETYKTTKTSAIETCQTIAQSATTTTRCNGKNEKHRIPEWLQKMNSGDMILR